MAKRTRKRPEIAPIVSDMTPMIDVVFQLLIFFMLSIKFKILEGKLSAYLPKDVGVNAGSAEMKEKVEIKLKVDVEGTKMDPLSDMLWNGDGPFRYGSDRSILISVGPKTTKSLDELAKRLADLRLQDPERPATIDPYPGTVYADVIAVLDVVMQANYTDVTFIGDRSGSMPKK